MLPAASRYASALGIFRILTGIWWFVHGYLKLTSPDWGGPSGTCANIMQHMASGTSGPYHDFMTNVAIPHASTIAMLVALGETLTGVSLILGLLTVVGGIVGTFLVLNYWTAGGGYGDLGSYSGLETGMMICTAIHAALPTGLVYGLDGLVARRAKKPAS